MRNYVAITTSDRGWALECDVRELTSRLPYARLVDEPDGSALINYYFTYSVRQYRASPIEVAYFSHLEEDETAREKFFTVAREVDARICMSEIYASILKERNLPDVHLIRPGCNTDIFTPKLRIGIVGREYHTGRKGSALVESLQDIDWIDWHFTGDGWPGPAQHLKEEELPDFYRSMDYILVSSRYEGGPKCVPEALACGTPVIAPPIGWVNAYEHIEYRTNDADDLRKVLGRLFEVKKRRAEKIAGQTWDAWAAGHDAVFQSLAARHGCALQNLDANISRKSFKVALITQANETGAKGGPSIRMPKTARLLSQWTGIRADAHWRGDPFPQDADLIHAFNSAREASGTTAESAWRCRIPMIISPIFLDPAEEKKFEPIRNIFKMASRDAVIEAELKKIAASVLPDDRLPAQEFDRLQNLFDKSAHAILLSVHEEAALKRYGFNLPEISIIRNPVEWRQFENADPDVFRKHFGLNEFVLCVGRLENRKNQLMLAYALKDTGIPLVLAGHAVDPEYLELIRRYGGPNLHLIGRLDHEHPLLASAYAAARVYCLPSWTEGASLANLEAAATGCNMVLSNRSSEREYFGSFARYCDPGDPASIRDAILTAWNEPLSTQRRGELKRHIREHCSWDRHVELTAQVYNSVMARRKRIKSQTGSLPALYIDVTRCARWTRPPVGMARVESEIASSMPDYWQGEARYVFWHEHSRSFVEISKGQFADGSYREMARSCDPALMAYKAPEKVFAPESILMVVGAEWSAVKPYCRDLLIAVNAARLHLVPFVHDAMPFMEPHLFDPAVVSIYTSMMPVLIAKSGCVLTNSRKSEADIIKALSVSSSQAAPVYYVRLGDHPESGAYGGNVDAAITASLQSSAGFVLYVSSISPNKNHGLLYNVWRELVGRHGIHKVPTLVCVGSSFAKDNPFIDVVSRDPLVRHKIRILHGVNDATLEWLYKNCLFTVYPSRYEGWGLPVAESLYHGKICVAAASTSIPEIAPEYTDLLDPDDFMAWYARVEGYALNGAFRRSREAKISSYIPVSWQDTAKQIANILATQTFRTVEFPLLNQEKTITDFSSCDHWFFLGGGWEEGKSAGIQTNAPEASLLFRIRQEDTPLEVTLKLRSSVDGTPVDVFINDELATRFYLDSRGSVNRIALPRNASSDGNIAAVKLSLRPLSPGRTGGGTVASPRLTLTSLNLQKMAESSVRSLGKLEELDKLIPGLGLPLRSLVSRRPDLLSMLDSQENVFHLLLWAWRFGIEEEPTLAKFAQELFGALRSLYSRQSEISRVLGFMLLHQLIWEARPDLHSMDIETADGQLAIIHWFDSYGANEYNLSELIA